MQPPRPHRLELRGVRLNRKEDDLLARDLGEVIEEALPDLGIDRGVLDRCIGEHEGGGIDPILRRGRRVGHHVAVRIGVAGIELELSRCDAWRERDRYNRCELRKTDGDFHDFLLNDRFVNTRLM